MAPGQTPRRRRKSFADGAPDVNASNATASAFLNMRRPSWMSGSAEQPHRPVPARVQNTPAAHSNRGPPAAAPSTDASSSPEPERIPTPKTSLRDHQPVVHGAAQVDNPETTDPSSPAASSAGAPSAGLPSAGVPSAGPPSAGILSAGLPSPNPPPDPLPAPAEPGDGGATAETLSVLPVRGGVSSTSDPQEIVAPFPPQLESVPPEQRPETAPATTNQCDVDRMQTAVPHRPLPAPIMLPSQPIAPTLSPRVSNQLLDPNGLGIIQSAIPSSTRAPRPRTSGSGRSAPQSPVQVGNAPFAQPFSDPFSNFLSSFRYLHGDLVEAEIQRYDCLRRAGLAGDQLFMALHQLSCCGESGSSNIPLSCQTNESAYRTIRVILNQSGNVRPCFYQRWAMFPRQINFYAVDNDEYGAAVMEALRMMLWLPQWFDNLLRKCRQRQFPPLVEDFLAPQRISSAIFQRLIFNNVVRDLWSSMPVEGWARASAVFEQDLSSHRSTTYSASFADVLRLTYRKLGEMLHPHQLFAQPAPNNTHDSPRSNTNAHNLNHPILPGPDVGLEVPAVPDPTVYALHLSHLREAPVRGSAHAAYQYPASFLLDPAPLVLSEYVQQYGFTVPSALLARRATQKLPAHEGALPTLHVEAGSVRARLHCKNGTAQVGIADWVARTAEWPVLSVFAINNVRVELRRKAQFGRCLPADVTNLLREGNNTLKIFNLAGKFRSTERTNVPQCVVAIEVVGVVSHDHVVTRVAARTKPARDCLAAILGKKSPDDDDVMSTGFTISVVDPISANSVWKMPVRGVHCRHNEAFDLDIFLRSRRTGKQDGDVSDVDVWRCPICLGDARPDVLVVDGWFLRIRQSLEEQRRLDVRRIEVDDSGEWRISEVDKHKRPDAKQSKSPADVEVIELD